VRRGGTEGEPRESLAGDETCTTATALLARAEDAMAKSLKAGDKVEWDSSGGDSKGAVIRKVTSPTKIKTHEVAASPDNPEYIVRSDKSGKEAAHKPGSLKKSR
jgi:Hypervirulence associated proteins TUDOR domain